ncbi:hypothetical protein N2605_27540 [Bradyrhizobium yuanmingense]|uniref:hypothetical protein n=1 Tax=Bradyrhizobium yuanmingense TaxID=108015 RepID=UPI0021A3E119|nr:hypothetical protein [Bradyrhizobium sp. CB1024]UWU83254.1 hypothetical protein N2605_27540 [Bradyrhizobium sp. CB1024]
MIEDMTVGNLSPETQPIISQRGIEAWPSFSSRSPAWEDVHTFQVQLVVTGIFWPHLNQMVCALHFFNGVTLGHSEIPGRIAYA